MPRVAAESAAVFAPSMARPRTEWRTLACTFALVCLATATVLAVALGLGRHYGVWFATLSRDPTQAAGVPFYVGIVSNLGILLWDTAVVVCLFAAALVRRDPARRDDMWFLASLGTLTAVLMLDDLFMVHDEVFPKYLGVPEEPIEALYLLMTLAFMLRFRRLLLRPQVLLFLSALALFGVSILIEYAPEGWSLRIHVIEDGSKLLGIANWLAYALWASFERLGGPVAGSRGGSQLL